MTIEDLGTLPDGRIVRRVRLSHEGATLDVLDLGAAVDAWVPRGARRSVVVGFDGDVAARWERRGGYPNIVAGRVISRVRDGRFTLDGSTYQLATNENGHTLHGGPDGFDARTWTIDETGDDHVTLSLVSPDGDQGFPGTVVATATYRLTVDAVTIELEATTDAPTVVALGSHPYFHVGVDPVLTVPAERWVPVDDENVALPGSATVAGSGFDLRRGLPVGPETGLDASFLVDGEGPRLMARLAGGDGTVEVHGDQVALQVYTGAERGIALEVQPESDAPNRTPEDVVLRPGGRFTSVAAWRFEPRAD
ncbi:MAG: hypothetical protein PGN07_00605 [Aeromicrobium erythreum]